MIPTRETLGPQNTPGAQPGDLIEFQHPQRGHVIRGRVTAAGQHGATARIADGTAVGVPHSHVRHIWNRHELPDYGESEDDADNQDTFLHPTKPHGLPAAPWQVGMIDVLLQYGLPIEDGFDIEHLSYDQAKAILWHAIAMPSPEMGKLGPEGGPDKEEEE